MKQLLIAASLAWCTLASAKPAKALKAPKLPAPVIDASNPFIAPSSLPLRYPAFDKIRTEHYSNAYEVGMALQLREIALIANNPAPATFDNTIVALERSGQMLARVTAVFSNLVGANGSDALDTIERDMAPKLAAHNDAVFLNATVFRRVQSLYERRSALNLDAESVYLLERYYLDFVRAGARLAKGDKEKLKALNAQIATLQTTFSQNLLKDSNASALVVGTREELAGLSDAAIEAAALEAKSRGLDGKFALTLRNTSGQPALALLTNRGTRQHLMEASMARGSHGGPYDNRAVIAKLAELRAERAALLGYPNYAAYALEDQTARSAATVNTLLADLARPAAANARREAADIGQALALDQPGAELAAHDWAYYADKVRAARFQFDENAVRPYFELDNVLKNGVFYAAGKLYGLSFKERKDLPVYHPDVRVFDVIDANGKPLAILIADYYARSNKRGGAWMNEYVSQNTLMGTHPVVANHLNIPKPPAGAATLLTFDEVRTMFHEFGHALHGMFSNVRYPRFAGTNVPPDFAEYPSKVNEMWATWPEVLKHYALHYQTGEPMPAELLDKVLASKKFNEGFRTTEYLGAAVLDQRWHQRPAGQPVSDPLAFEAQALKDAGLDVAAVPPRYRSTYFSHSFSSGGYAASYYAYIWSEKLDADTVQWFKENGGLLRANGDRFRATLLSRGGSADALGLFRTLRGRDASIEPLLERLGLKP
jgi:peptidyl-dipeptidase Dcp